MIIKFYCVSRGKLVMMSKKKKRNDAKGKKKKRDMRIIKNQTHLI